MVDLLFKYLARKYTRGVDRREFFLSRFFFAPLRAYIHAGYNIALDSVVHRMYTNSTFSCVKLYLRDFPSTISRWDSASARSIVVLCVYACVCVRMHVFMCLCYVYIQGYRTNCRAIFILFALFCSAFKNVFLASICTES